MAKQEGGPRTHARFDQFKRKASRARMEKRMDLDMHMHTRNLGGKGPNLWLALSQGERQKGVGRRKRQSTSMNNKSGEGLQPATE